MQNRRSFLAPAAAATFSWVGSAMAANDRPQNSRSEQTLCVTATEWASLAERRQADPDLDRLVVTLLERARQDLSLPLLERRLEGRRLLDVSRQFLRRVLQWSFAYRVQADPVFLARARQEMLNVASFSDWHPEHFLDVAEMCAGLALALDWLRGELSGPDRAVMHAALIDKGIAQARRGHKTFQSTNNWNQVCIGGMVLGALAVATEQPALASEVLAAARRALPVGLKAYQPDGIYPEGPAYWEYGTCYSVITAAALRSADLPDGGILAAPGFIRSAEFYAQAMGPTGKAFNFADGNEAAGFPCALVYLAREAGQVGWLASMRQSIRARRGLSDRFAPLAALWWPSASGGKVPSRAFSGQGPQSLAIWRSAWNDPQALWFAIKAGGAAHNHGHMDAGSFVLDWGGVRWVRDLGMQDYHSLESQGIDLWNMSQTSPRWQVYRISAEAHNTLTLLGQPHSARDMASLLMVDEQEMVVDLSKVLTPGFLGSARRRARVNEHQLQLDDEVLGLTPGTVVRWAVQTEADVHIEGNRAVLRQSDKSLTVEFQANGLVLSVVNSAQPRRAFDAVNPKMRQLIAQAPADAHGQWHLSVRWTLSQ